MKLSIESFVSLIIIVLIIVISICTLTSSADVRNAQNFHSAMVSEIEASDCAQSVIDKCKEKAIANGYTELEVTKINSYYEVTLVYEYSIPVINEIMNHTIVGYAR